MSNARLVWGIACAIAAIAGWFALRPVLPVAWGTPGSRELYLTGVVGAMLLLVPAAFALAKRSGHARAPRSWFDAHVACSLAGAVLIAAHSGGYLRHAPALLLAAIVALAGLGAWARMAGARRMAATFSSKEPSFAPPGPAERERLRAIIGEKHRLLAALDPHASENTFSVTLAHGLRHPRLASAYARLAREEARLIGSRAAVGFAQAWWRPLHLAIAWLFVAGVLVHVVVVTFFATYAAHGGPVTWWHLRS